MAGTKAEKPLVTTTVQVFADDWSVFKEICGQRGASARLRKLMSEEIERESRERVAARVFSEYAEA